MEKQGYKVLAVVVIIVWLFTVGLVWWIYNLGVQEYEQESECYYDLCNQYADAWLDNDVCFCYEYDMLGEAVVAKTTYMRD